MMSRSAEAFGEGGRARRSERSGFLAEDVSRSALGCSERGVLAAGTLVFGGRRPLVALRIPTSSEQARQDQTLRSQSRQAAARHAVASASAASDLGRDCSCRSSYFLTARREELGFSAACGLPLERTNVLPYFSPPSPFGGAQLRPNRLAAGPQPQTSPVRPRGGGLEGGHEDGALRVARAVEDLAEGSTLPCLDHNNDDNNNNKRNNNIC